jgi:hypothetical protein
LLPLKIIFFYKKNPNTQVGSLKPLLLNNNKNQGGFHVTFAIIKTAYFQQKK